MEKPQNNMHKPFTTIGFLSIFAMFFGCSKYSSLSNSLEETGFVQTMNPSFLSSIKKNAAGDSYTLRIHNNPSGLNESDSLSLFLNQYLVYSGPFKETAELQFPHDLADKIIQPAIKISSHKKQYWFIDKEGFKTLPDNETTTKIIHVVFTPSNFTDAPFVVFASGRP